MSRNFEIDMVVRDAQGNPTNKRKTFSSDSGFKIAQFWSRNHGIQRKKKRKIDEAASKEQAEKTLNEIYKEKENDNNSARYRN